ncbi:NepR family anti-sigma factor [Methylobacterium fujisawaense]|uniref:NepR family anti-sigma factor n=1 Tax=Methylobacterium fujisawaense TaxID=107400 RepID=UPI00313DA88E
MGCAAVGPRPARRAGAPGRSIDGAARDRIGRGLRLHYAGVLALPIPDRLRTLLDDLAACSDTEASQ